MRRLSPTLLLILIGLFTNHSAHAQGDSLLPGQVVERTLASGQRHNFTINLEKDQFLQFVVEQQGIDVVIRVFSPDGKGFGEFDTPNGTEGPENVVVISEASGSYRVEVAPLSENVGAGRYVIKIIELRRATSQEIAAGKNQEALKARGLELLRDVAGSFSQIRLPQTRVRAQLQAVRLLWQTDEKLAARLAADAMESVKEYIANVDPSRQDYYQSYEVALQLRQEVVHALATSDPDTAINFLRATRGLPRPDTDQNWDRELAIEVTLANQILPRDPQRAALIAEDTLKRGYSGMLLEIIHRLRVPEPELASKLAKQVAAKLQTEKLLKNPEAASLAVSLLQQAQSPMKRMRPQPAAQSPPKTDAALLSDDEYKDLFEKTLNEALAYSGPSGNHYSPERSAAQNILSAMKAMPQQVSGYAPARETVIDRRIAELSTPTDPQSARWQKYTELVGKGTVDEGLQAAAEAPREIRDSLFQQVAYRAMGLGDAARARQIVNDHISGSQRQQMLAHIEQQAIRMDASKGKIEEALRAVNSLSTPRERVQMLSQIVNQIGSGMKRAALLDLLEQARSQLGPATRAENQDQMNALLEISRAFAQYDSKRAFEVLEPLLDQFNEMATAALVLNGFGQDFYEDGELMMQNSSSMANLGNQLILSLGSLAPANFDRAKAGADRLERPEVRIIAYLTIAEKVIAPDENRRGGGRRFERE